MKDWHRASMALEHCPISPPLLQKKRCFPFLTSQENGTSKNHPKAHTCSPEFRNIRIWSSCSKMLYIRGHLELAEREGQDIEGWSYIPNSKRKTRNGLSQRTHYPRGIRHSQQRNSMWGRLTEVKLRGKF